MFPYFSPQFLALFDDPSTSLSTVMAYPQLSAASRADVGLVNNYLAKHIQEILNIVLTDNTESQVSSLINILSCAVPEIFHAMMTKSRFADMATEILSDQFSSETVIARLSTITLSALLALPEEVSKSCGFIYHLLHRCDNSCAFNLFSTILSGDDEHCEGARKWLQSFGFTEYLIREINKIDFDNYKSSEKVPYFDRVYAITSSLYQLLTKCLKIDTLKSDFLNVETITSLSKRFRHQPPSFVSNARWKAIRNLVCKKTAKEMSSLLPEVVKILSADHQNRLCEFHVSAILFTSQIIMHEPMYAIFAIDEKVPGWILGLFLHFQNSTILHSAVREFVEVAVEIEPLGSILVEMYAPMLIEEARIRQAEANKVLLPTVFALIEAIRDAAARRKEVAAKIEAMPEFAAFCMKELEVYKMQSEMSYGGRMKSSLSAFLSSFL